MGTEQAPNNNPNPHVGHAGLDPNGEMRVGDKYTLAARGGSMEIRGPHGRKKTVTEAEFQDMLEDTYFPEG